MRLYLFSMVPIVAIAAGCGEGRNMSTRVPPCEQDVVTYTADDFATFMTKSGFKMRIPAGFVTETRAEGCVAASAVLHLFWVDGEFKPLKVNNKDQGIPVDAERTILVINFEEPRSPPVASRRQTSPWQFEGSYPLGNLGMVVHPNFTNPTRDFVPSRPMEPWIGIQDIESAMQKEYIFNCRMPADSTVDEMIDFSTPVGGFCRGGWSIAPGAGGPLDISGRKVLQSMRAKIEALEVLTQSFIVKE